MLQHLQRHPNANIVLLFPSPPPLFSHQWIEDIIYSLFLVRHGVGLATVSLRGAGSVHAGGTLHSKPRTPH